MRFNREETEHRWLEAAKSYEQEIKANPQPDSSPAEYWERIGFCYDLSSRQAKDMKTFRELRQLAVGAYEKAAQLHEKNQGKVLQCLATAELTRSWLAPNPQEKRKTLESCRTLGKRALRIYRRIGDELNCGKTCNTLAFCVYNLQSIIPTLQGKRKILQEGFDDATEAVAVFSNLSKNEKNDLILALCLSSILGTFLAEVSNQETEKSLGNSCLRYSKKAMQLSNKVDDPYSKAMARWAATLSRIYFEEKIEKRSSLEYPEEMLRQALAVRDNYLTGIAYYYLAGSVFADIQEEADPYKKQQRYEDIIKYSQSAIQYLQLANQNADVAVAYLFYAESNSFLAREFAVTPTEKLIFFKEAVRAGEKGLDYALRSGSPSALESNLHGLSKAYQHYSTIEPSREKRTELLRKALKYRKQEIESTRTAFASNFWYTGIGMIYAAQIEAELARLEENQGNKAGFFEDAVTHMEKGVSQCKKQLERITVPSLIAHIAGYEDSLGGMLEECYFLTKNQENLKKANQAYREAAENFGKIELPSRIAEAYWKIANNLDLLNDYETAARNFENAFAGYEASAQKIHQFSGLYLDYATYMKAWSEIELAKLAHDNQQYDIARQHYERASALLKESKAWSYLTSNFCAWSLLEHAEDLSRRESCKESIEAFGEAIRFFQQSKQFLSTKLSGIRELDVKEMVERLIKVSNARGEYSQGRIAVEEAKILDKQGHYADSSEKYGSAAHFFQNLLQVDSEQIRNEAKPLFYLCKAWQKMTMAEARVSPGLYAEAAELFKLAKEHMLNESASLLALANSSFCRALEAGTQFEITRKGQKSLEAREHMNDAANYYLKAGFDTSAEYAKATQRLFDAYVFMENAKRETKPGNEVKYYLMAEKVLQLSAESFAKAKYTKKTNQVERLLARVKEEKELALSLSEVFHAPSIASSTASFETISLSEEKAVGLARFEHSDVEAKLIKQENEVTVGQELSLDIQVANLGKEPVWMTKIENIIPAGFQILKKPENSSFENATLTFKAKRLNPLTTEEIRVVLRPFKKGCFTLKPRITCIDETGSPLFHDPEALALVISEAVLSGRVSTGSSDLDSLLLGGIPDNYAVILTSPSSDEREMLVRNFLEVGVKGGQIVFYITGDASGVEDLAREFASNFYVFVCNPGANPKIDNSPNVFKLQGVENLTEINISIFKALRSLSSSETSSRRACIEVLSDVLLQHHAVVTKNWLSGLLQDLKSKGFTTLAVVNSQMHPQEEVQAILDQFGGEIQIYERETKEGLRQVLRIRKLYGQRYLDNELILQKPNVDGSG